VAVYTVHIPGDSESGESGDIEAFTDRFVFIPERFSVLAMLFALPWLLVHRLWLASAAYLVLIIALNALGAALGLSEQMLGFLSLAISVLVGFEAHNLRRLSLERSGFRLAGVVSASNREEAEHKFFSEWLRERVSRPKPSDERQTPRTEAAAPA